MTARSRMLLGALAAALLVALAALPASANQAYDRVATAYAQSNSQLAPCAFTTAQLEAALRGTPPVFRTTVPELRRAIQNAIVAHKRGDCKGVRPEEGTTGGAAAGTVPRVTTTPATTAPAPAATVPTTTATTPVAPAPAATTPAPAPPVQPAAASSGGGSDRTVLLIALIALGALLLAALAVWGTARNRGWDPAWVARMRHAWGEAGFRTTSTWAEFTDWLRLGR